MGADCHFELHSVSSFFQNSGDMFRLAYRRHHITCLANVRHQFLLSGCALYNPPLFCCLPFFRLWAAAPLAPTSLPPSVYLSLCVHKKAMTVVQTAVVFVTVEAIPLHKVIVGFTSSLLQHQRQYSAHIVLSCYPVRQSVSCKHNRWQHDRHRSFCALD